MRVRSRVLLVVLAIASFLVSWRNLSAQTEGGWATITGTVTDKTTGQPISNIEVQTDSVSNTIISTTDDEGIYSLRLYVGYTDGDEILKVRFTDPTSTYVDMWYEDGYFISKAKSVRLAPGQILPINMQLQRAGEVRGTITTNLKPDDATYLTIEIYDADNRFTYYDAITLAHEMSPVAYRFVGVPPGRYITLISFYHESIADYAYTHAFYDLQPSQSRADTITVSAGITSTANSDLTNLGTIRGTVRLRSFDQPIVGAEVIALNEDGFKVAAAYSQANGLYQLKHLVPGTYTIQLTGRVRLCNKGNDCPFPIYMLQELGELQVRRGQVISDINAQTHLIFGPVAYLPLVMR